MSSTHGPTTVDIDPQVIQDIRQFRLKKQSKGNAAYIVKIDKLSLCLIKDNLLDHLGSLSDLIDEDFGILPDNTPRFIILSYELKHNDGRISYPLIIINWSPQTSSLEMKTLYASALPFFTNSVDIMKVIDIRDGELNDKIIQDALK